MAAEAENKWLISDFIYDVKCVLKDSQRREDGTWGFTFKDKPMVGTSRVFNFTVTSLIPPVNMEEIELIEIFGRKIIE